MKTPNVLRGLPSVTELLESQPLRQLVKTVSHNVVVSGARVFLNEMRGELQKRAENAGIPPVTEIAENIAQYILKGERTTLRPAINATGILLHTGLGRAPLAKEAIEAIAVVASGYASVELDLPSGKRSKREGEVESLLCQLTGAAAALVVNNNAGATLLALQAIASGREVLVSRGQLVEIGGSFRLPSIMSASGATLQEVGTTNKTHLADYADAMNENTAAILQVHPSNFRVVGFTESPKTEELAALAHKHQLPFIDDIGSGAMLDFSIFGCKNEPTVSASLNAGADLVLFSGDKLLGGPQCGIILGKQAIVDRLARSPLARALRVGKLSLAALAATLRLYRDPQRAKLSIPLLQLLETPLEGLKNRAERLAPQIAAASTVASAEVVSESAFLGGGSVPDQAIPTWCIAITPESHRLDSFAEQLRSGEQPIVARVHKNRILLDLRTVFPSEDIRLVEAIVGMN